MTGLKGAAEVARCRKRGDLRSRPSMIRDADQREYVIERPQATEPNWRYRPIPLVRAFPTWSLNVLRRKRTACGLSDGARIGQCHVISSLELNLPNSSPLSRRRCRLLAPHNASNRRGERRIKTAIGRPFTSRKPQRIQFVQKL